MSTSGGKSVGPNVGKFKRPRIVREKKSPAMYLFVSQLAEPGKGCYMSALLKKTRGGPTRKISVGRPRKSEKIKEVEGAR